MSSSQIIFVGEVVESHATSWWVWLNERLGSFTPFGFNGVDRRSLVRVAEPLKGRTDSRLWFEWFDGCCACDIDLSKGKRILIFTLVPPKGEPWKTTTCDGSRALNTPEAYDLLRKVRRIVRAHQ